MQTSSKIKSRSPRYCTSLSAGSFEVQPISSSWNEILPVEIEECETKFLDILKDHGFEDIQPVVPLRSRYTRGRRWTSEEFMACFIAWESGISLTLISAALNRNPQDIIYRLLDYCHSENMKFTEKGRSEGVENWTTKVANCAYELFEKGLPAWKIATLFRVDFEHVEKQLFVRRTDYGHQKRNPFEINTKHKRFVNELILKTCQRQISQVLDAFAGEGVTTKLISQYYPKASVTAVESNSRAFSIAESKKWNDTVQWIYEDNCSVIARLNKANEKFDLIDLDPFVTCHEQLEMVWSLLKSSALLFITFGGEYRRSFISTNRKAIAKRYGFYDPDLTNSEYLEIVPSFFLGWAANLAIRNSFTFSVMRTVRYANNCRFWLSVESVSKKQAIKWRDKNIIESKNGFQFRDLHIPRFAEIRRELDAPNQESLFPL